MFLSSRIRIVKHVSFSEDPDLSWDEGDMPNTRIQIWSFNDFMEQYNNMYSWLNNIQVLYYNNMYSWLNNIQVLYYNNMYSWLNNIQVLYYNNMYSRLNNIQVLYYNNMYGTPGSTTSRYCTVVQQHVLLAQQHPGIVHCTVVQHHVPVLLTQIYYGIM